MPKVERLLEAPPEKLLRLRELRAEVARQRDARELALVGDPCRWAETHGVWLWSKPREILESVRDNRLTIAHAGVGISKTHTAAAAAAWWIETRHRLGTVRVVTTSTSWPQVRGELWQEINRLHHSANLSGRVTQTEWWIGTDMVGLGRKPADYDATGLHGYHAEYVLVIIDEISGVPQGIIDAARGLATGDDDRILALGNPDFQGSTFDRLCAPGSVWHTIHMDVLDSPNFTGEPVPEHIARALTGPAYVADMAEEYGEDSAIYQAKVRGRFPSDQDDGVVAWSKLAPLTTPHPIPWGPADLLPVELGVDVGAGGDMSVIRERRGPVVGRVWRDRQPDTMRVVGLVMHAIEATGATRVKVDATGIGKGVADRLNELRTEGKHQASVAGVMVGEASSQPHRFARLRSELWWVIGRELTETAGWDFSEAEDPTGTMGQLVAPRYSFDSAGRVQVEKKEDTRKRLGRSPDDADALLLAFYAPKATAEDYLEQLIAARK